MTLAASYADLGERERQFVESAARSGDWIGKYGVEGFSPENRIWNAIEAAFYSWRENPRNIPYQVREIFGRLDKAMQFEGAN